jgi:hypothetical protein
MASGFSTSAMFTGQHTPRETSIFKREVEMEMMLPFKIRRLEKNNNNGEKK